MKYFSGFIFFFIELTVQRRDRVIEYLHDEDAGLGAAAADADAEVLPGLPLQGDAQHVLGVGCYEEKYLWG